MLLKMRHVSWCETCTCKFKSDGSVCNGKQHWNNGKCRCECKEFDKNVILIMDLFAILVIVNVNVINHVMLENI